jgi:hypothetical protein
VGITDIADDDASQQALPSVIVPPQLAAPASSPAADNASSKRSSVTVLRVLLSPRRKSSERQEKGSPADAKKLDVPVTAATAVVTEAAPPAASVPSRLFLFADAQRASQLLYDARRDHVWVANTHGKLKVVRGATRVVKATLDTHTACIVRLITDDNGDIIWSAAVNGQLTAWDAVQLVPTRNVILRPDAHLGQVLTDIAPCGPLLWCSLGEQVLGVRKERPDAICCRLDMEAAHRASVLRPSESVAAALSVVHSICEGTAGQLWCASHQSRYVSVWDTLQAAELSARRARAISERDAMFAVARVAASAASSFDRHSLLASPVSPTSLSPLASSYGSGLHALDPGRAALAALPAPRRLVFWQLECQGVSTLQRAGDAQVWAGGTDGGVYAWDAQRLAPLFRVGLHTDLVRCLAALAVREEGGPCNNSTTRDDNARNGSTAGNGSATNSLLSAATDDRDEAAVYESSSGEEGGGDPVVAIDVSPALHAADVGVGLRVAEGEASKEKADAGRPTQAAPFSEPTKQRLLYMASGSASGDGAAVLYPMRRLLSWQGDVGSQSQDALGFNRLAAREGGGIGAHWDRRHLPWVEPQEHGWRVLAMDVDSLGAGALAHHARWDALAAMWPEQPTVDMAHMCRNGVPAAMRKRVWRMMVHGRTRSSRRFRGEGYYTQILEYKTDRADPKKPKQAQQIEVRGWGGILCEREKQPNPGCRVCSTLLK